MFIQTKLEQLKQCLILLFNESNLKHLKKDYLQKNLDTIFDGQ